MTEISQVITSVGFPIVAYLLMFSYMQKIEESHKEEMSKMTDALNNNTLAIQHLTDMQAQKEKNNGE